MILSGLMIWIYNPTKRCRVSHTSAGEFKPMFWFIGHGALVGSNGELLLALEQMLAQGVPCFGEIKERFGCPIDFEGLLAAREISRASVRGMAGNAWQLMPVGLLYIYLLSKLEFRTDAMLRRMMNPGSSDH